jgi:hypothetical protein
MISLLIVTEAKKVVKTEEAKKSEGDEGGGGIDSTVVVVEPKMLAVLSRLNSRLLASLYLLELVDSNPLPLVV